LVQTIRSPATGRYDNFGNHIHLNEDRLIISSTGHENEGRSTGSGAAFIYHLSTTDKWGLKNQITPKDGIERFGSSVFINNTYAVVASDMNETAWTYKLDAKLNAISEQVFLKPTPDLEGFAASVSMTNDYFFIGSEGEIAYQFFDTKTPPLTDSVFVMRIASESEQGYFRMEKKLIPNIQASLGSFNISRQEFRKEAVRYETWEQHEERKAGAGSVLVYKKGENENWKFAQELIASDRGADDNFGMCLSADDSLLIVGAFGDALENTAPAEARYRGAAYIFELTRGGKWKEIKKLTSYQKKKWLKFGFSVDIENRKAVIGSRFEYTEGVQQGGGVYLWEK